MIDDGNLEEQSRTAVLVVQSEFPDEMKTLVMPTVKRIGSENHREALTNAARGPIGQAQPRAFGLNEARP